MASNQIDYLSGKSDKSARDTFLYYSGKDPSAVRYKNWKMYFAMVSDAPAGFIAGVQPYHWTQVVNIKRDPFETSIGTQIKTLFGMGGAIASPSPPTSMTGTCCPSARAVAEATRDLHRLPAAAGPGQLQPGAGHAAGQEDEVRPRLVASMLQQERAAGRRIGRSDLRKIPFDPLLRTLA